MPLLQLQTLQLQTFQLRRYSCMIHVTNLFRHKKYASKRTRKTSTGRHIASVFTKVRRRLLQTVDHARAVFKYGGKKQRSKDVVDLSGIPPQPPIPKSAGRKDGASKYAGITFRKQQNKWQARIRIGGKKRTIGDYDDKEEAAVDYARAVYKYKEINAAKVPRGRRKSRKHESSQRVQVIDITNITY